ncbi:MAG: DUF4339 domain-containing protein [Phycisphaerae bacterium]|nr:DUF4339 domain-containing protein [Phycisphaerae bacterium]
MSAHVYYIRTRGRISGPFDLETVRRMARRGELSLIQELSLDAVTWLPGRSFPLVFANAAETTSADDGANKASGTGISEQQPGGADRRAAVPEPSTGGDSYYLWRGPEMLGPFLSGELREMAARGEVRSDDRVRARNHTSAVRARELPFLSDLFPSELQTASPKRGWWKKWRRQ